MRKGTFIATIALLIAIAGAIVAFAAYFKRRSCALCDDLDDELMDDMSDLDYYATQVDEDDEEECYATTCPECEEEIFFDDSVLEDGKVECPNCGATLEFDPADLVEDEEEKDD